MCLCCQLWTRFLFAGVFSKAKTQRNCKEQPYLYVQEFSREYIGNTLHGNAIVFFVHSKNLKLYGKKIQCRSCSSEADLHRCLQYRCYWLFCKAPVVESLYNEVSRIQPAVLWQKRSRHRCFPSEFNLYLLYSNLRFTQFTVF